MGALLFILPVIAIFLAIKLLRGLPRRRQVWLACFAIACTAITFSMGYQLGGIAPEYRGNIAINRLIRDSNRAFDVGDCEQVRTAFSEANRFTEGGGSLHDAVTMISERLRLSSSAPTFQPPSRHPTASPNPH